MLWSLIKILFFVSLVVGLTIGVGYWSEAGPNVRLAIGAMEFNLGPLQAVIAALLVLGAVWLLFKAAGLLVAFLKFLNGDETALSRYFSRNRERKGYQLLSDALLALSSGEGREAMTKAQKAEKYLRRPEVTGLVIAQAAEMVGDKSKAHETYRALLSNDKTRFVGIRGVLGQKLEEGDTDTALQLAQKAFALRPKNDGVADTLLELQAGAHDWKGARKTLGAKLKAGNMPRDLHRRRDAVLAVGQAKEMMADGSSPEAQQLAIEAARLAPDLVPAAVLAARSYTEQGKPKYAARVIKKAWETSPHPELATAFAAIEPDESPRARIKRFEPLLRLRPDDTETKLLRAELLIGAEDFPAARRAMGDLATEEPTTRSLAIMAAVERGTGAPEEVVRGWLTRAMTAPRGPQWVCDVSETVYPEWVPISGGFDTLSWRTPQQVDGASPTGAEMLPLMVGETPDATPEEPPAETPDDKETASTEAAPSAPAEEEKEETAEPVKA
ncbi:MAG: heme biosynthesis HemY N-terminal domain-containing protein [Pseudomonadota bacterium]